MHEADFRLYVQDILDAIERIDQYLEGITFEQFSKDNKTIDAVVRNFTVIVKPQKTFPPKLSSIIQKLPGKE